MGRGNSGRSIDKGFKKVLFALFDRVLPCENYAPKSARDRILLRPSVDEVIHALTTHPDWPGVPGE